jgi:hypothetical protein
VGGGFYHSVGVGWALWISQVTAGVILGVIMGAFAKRERENNDKAPDIKEKISLGEAFVKGTKSAVFNMGTVCGTVVFFSAGGGILKELGIYEGIARMLGKFGVENKIATSLLSLITEVTTGCSTAGANRAPVWLIAFALSFGGLCVQLQIAAILGKNHLMGGSFFLSRLAHGILSALVCTAILPLFPGTQEVWLSTGQTLSAGYYGSVLGGAALLAACMAFLATLGREEVRLRFLPAKKE